MSKTFSAGYSNITLSNPAYNPVSVTSAGMITGTATALYGQGPTAWTVTNTGTIAGGTTASGAGIVLQNGGSVSNKLSAAISGYVGIGIYQAAGSVLNASSIDATGGAGVLLQAGGAVTNLSSGSISAGSQAVYISNNGSPGSYGTLVNFGALFGGSNSSGAFLSQGTVTNQMSGLISGGQFGVQFQYAAATVVNYGSIVAGATYVGTALYLPAGGQITNQSGGIISGAIGVRVTGGAGAVVNFATVTGSSGSAIELASGGTIANQSSGTITGGTSGEGVLIEQGGTLINAGTIIASTGQDAVYLQAGYTNRLVIDPGAVFTGVVNGGNALGDTTISTLELASGASKGKLAGFGTQYYNFTNMTIDASATWNIDGYFNNTIINAGSLDAPVTIQPGGYLSNQATGTISGAPTADFGAVIANGASVVNAGLVENTGSVGLASGVYLQGVVSLTNTSGAAIEGSSGVAASVGATPTINNAGTIIGTASNGYGIVLQGSGSLTNSGQISASGVGGLGVLFKSGGAVTNQTTGTIVGANGLDITGTPATLINYGTLAGTIGMGVSAGALSYISNASGGLITGAANGLVIGDGGTLKNAGTIDEGAVVSGYGVHLSAAALVNDAGGLIYGYYGVTATGGGTIIDAGSIGGSAISVRFEAGYTNLLKIIPGALFTGSILGGNPVGGSAVSTLELAAGTSSDTLHGLGILTTGFANVTVDASAVWTLSSAVAGAGYELADNGTLTTDGSLGSTVTLGANAYLDNLVTGTISVAGVAVLGLAAGTATVVNAGLIAGDSASNSDGIRLSGGGNVTNQSGGTISGYDGVQFASGTGGVVVNAGNIIGSHDAVEFTAGSTNRLVIYPGAVFTGAVQGGNAIGSSIVSTLELASSASTGALTSLGSDYVNFAQVAVDTGAIWTFDTSDLIATGVTLTNSGTITGPVTLADGAILTNTTSGTISASYDAVAAPTGVSTVVNAGDVADALHAGLDLRGGGVVSNATSGTISGGIDGVTLAGIAGTVSNYGSIIGSASNGAGVVLSAGGLVTNATSGTITGGQYGILAGNVAATVNNSGSIYGSTNAGIALLEGGTLSNAATGVINGGGGASKGVYANGAAATVTNAGNIEASDKGVDLLAGGSVDNVSGGSIAGNTAGVIMTSGSLDNAGLVRSTYQGHDGVFLQSGGVVTNESTGTISGTHIGLYAGGDVGTVTNFGTIIDVYSSAIVLIAGGEITNQQSATISGALAAVYISGSTASVINDGVIAGTSSTSFGLNLANGGTLTNQSDGTISAGVYGVFIHGGSGTIVNAGTIAVSGSYAVRMSAGYANRAVLDPGAVFTGTVDGGNALGASVVSTLELASGVSTGTLNGLGTNYIDFGVLIIDPGAHWIISGSAALSGIIVASSFVNTGTIAGDITLAAGAYLSNASSGVINGQGTAAVYGTSSGVATVVNAGLIDPATYGIYLPGGGTVTNLAGGTILGSVAGVMIKGAAGTVSNAGSIVGGTAAVRLASGFANRLIDDPGGYFSGTVDGGNTIGASIVSTLEMASGASVGTLSGLGTQFINFAHITIDAGASWTFLADAIGAGYTIADAGTLTNTGSLGSRVTLGTGASLIDLFGATIATSGTAISGAGTVENAGSISGGVAAIAFTAGHANRLIVDPGAVFSGKVNGGNPIGASFVSTLELAAGTSAGTLAGLGAQFIQFGAVTVDSDASWTLTTDAIGTGYAITDAGTLTNTGTIGSTVTLGVGAVLSNVTGGLIDSSVGVLANAAATVMNAGSIGQAQIGYGVHLFDGGSVTNLSGGIISGLFGVYIDGANNTVVNAGDITGSGSACAIALDGGGSVTNQSGGTISGPNGIAVKLGAGIVVNAGSIIASGGSGSRAIGFAAGYTNRLVVDAGASFSGTVDGGNTIGSSVVSTLELASDSGAGTLTGLGPQFIHFAQVTVDAGAHWALSNGSIASGVTLTNSGTIGSPVTLDAGATLFNLAGATIAGTGGNYGGYGHGAAATVANYGSITGSHAGVELSAGGVITNQSGGTISSGTVGVRILNAAGTVTNAGAIAGGTFAVAFASGFANRLISDPGASFSGAVDGGNTIGATIVSTLELASGATTGTFDSLGSQFVDFAQVTVDAGAYWTLSSTSTINSGVTLTNSGMIDSTVNVGAGGRLINTPSGTIASGANNGIYGTGGGPATVENAGSIAGSVDAVLFEAGYADRVIVDPTAVFSGIVDGGNSIGASIASTLELASGASEGTLNSLGSQFIDFAQVTVDAGAYWSLGSTSTVVAGETLTNSGSLVGPVFLAGGAVVTNTSGGHIAAAGNAIYAAVAASPVSITNDGAILQNTTYAALELLVGATITNSATGSIVGGNRAIDIQGGAGTVINQGSIGVSTSLGSGVLLRTGGLVSNASSGTIAGLGFGAYLSGGGTVNNDGSIDGAGNVGVAFSAGGAITNTKGGTVTGHYEAILFNNSAGTVVNDGTVQDNTGTGILLNGAGSVVNQADGTIAALNYGVQFSNVVGTVTNQGSVDGINNFGAGLFAGGTVDNEAGGTFTGYGGVQINNGAGTVTNAGSIGATGSFAVRLAGGYTNLLIVDPGGSFNGKVEGGNAPGSTTVSTLELASGASAGTLSGLGVQFLDFAQVTIDANAAWTLNASNTIDGLGTLTNSGTLELTGAALTDGGGLVNDGVILLDPSTLVAANLVGSGSATIGAGSTLEVQDTIASGQTVVFAGSGAYLHLDSPSSDSGVITNFNPGETIDLKGVVPATVHYAAGKLNFGSDDSLSLSLGSGGTVIAEASGDGAVISSQLCFCVNTHISTPNGPVAVQDLAVGDAVVTHNGIARQIVWIGMGRVLATRGRRNAATPVIVHRGALADNVPYRDLRLTKGHALYLDDVLIPVEYLINHRSIVWDDHAQEVLLYHIELETHDVLVADGVAAESYRDDGNRWLFQNANSGWSLPPQQPCAPIVTGGPVVDAVWRRLLDRTGPRPGLPLTDEADLHLLADGRRVDAAERQGGAYVFPLLARPKSLRIVSRASAPQEVGLARDPRLLGVALRRIAVRQGTRFRVLKSSELSLTDGFYAFEPREGLRWTDGDAALPAKLFTGFNGPMELVLHIGGTTQYPALGDAA